MRTNHNTTEHHNMVLHHLPKELPWPPHHQTHLKQGTAPPASSSHDRPSTAAKIRGPWKTKQQPQRKSPNPDPFRSTVRSSMVKDDNGSNSNGFETHPPWQICSSSPALV
ncbi:hypothetical protein ACLOJK_022714 [Asimina triloba]